MAEVLKSVPSHMMVLRVDGVAHLGEKRILPATEKRGQLFLASFDILGSSIVLFLDQPVFDQLVQGFDYELRGQLKDRDGLRLVNPEFKKIEVK